MSLSNKKKIVLLCFCGVAVILSSIFLTVYVIHSKNRVTTNDAYIEGRVHSIASKVPGTVKKVYVNDNQRINKDELLVELDDADYIIKVNETQTALDAEKSKLIDAEIGIKTAQTNLEIQEVSFNQANYDKQRAEALYKNKVFPKEKYERVLTAYMLAAAQVKAAKEQREKAQSFAKLEETLVTQRAIAVKEAQLNLSYCKIYAMTDGYVTKKSVEIGNQIVPSQPLMAIVALDNIWLVANYKETQLQKVRSGQRVKIRVDTYPGKVFTGQVDSIMSGTGAAFSLFPAENAMGNYVKVVQRIPVKIVLDKDTDKNHVLRIGMSCVPTIFTKEE